MFVAFGIRHTGWSIPDCFLLSWKTTFRWLSLVVSGMWSLSFVFVEPMVAQHYQHWHFLALLESPRWLSIICTDMVIPIFFCAVRFNPWYVDFISGPSSCENQPWFSCWLSSSFHSFRRRLVSLKPFFCGLQYSAGLLWFMAKPSALVILCGLCSWKNIHGGHGRHIILKYNHALHVQIPFILKRLKCISWMSQGFS